MVDPVWGLPGSLRPESDHVGYLVLPIAILRRFLIYLWTYSYTDKSNPTQNTVRQERSDSHKATARDRF